jgi:F420H(2)-dependent quinone reductase
MPTPTPPPFGPSGSLRLKLTNLVTGANVWIYRRTSGRVGGRIGTAPVLLVDHVGRKSGRARTTPLLYLQDGRDLVIVASRAGSDSTPAWWLNLKANPATTAQVGPARRKVITHQATPEEKAALWPRLVEMYGDYAVYQQRTKREIPVIILSPAD